MSEKKKEMKVTTDESQQVKEEGVSKEVKAEVAITTNTTPSSVSTKKEEVAVTLTEQELQTLDYIDFSTPARMLELGKVLAKSQLVPLKKPEDVVVAIMTGKELGLPFIASVSQIYPINGRPTLGVHIQKALLLKSGVTYEKIEDAVAIYDFVLVEEDKSLTPLGEGVIEDFPVTAKKKKVDTRTTYLFTREVRMASGKYKTITAKSSFSLREAKEADLLEKDVWIKYWRRMLDSRAFTIGAREIADDILLGIYAPNELSNDFYINEQQEEVYNAKVID